MLDLLHEIFLSSGLKIYSKPMPIHQENNSLSINGFYLYCSILKNFDQFVQPQPMCMKLPLKTFKLWIIEEHSITWLDIFFLINVSLHLLCCCCVKVVCWTTSILISPSSINCKRCCYHAFERSNPKWNIVLKVLI